MPAPDPVRYTTPKAYITLAAGHAADRATAAAIFEHVRGRLSPYKRVRRIEFRRTAEDRVGQNPPRRTPRARERRSPIAASGPRASSGSRIFRRGRAEQGGSLAAWVGRLDWRPLNSVWLKTTCEQHYWRRH